MPAERGCTHPPAGFANPPRGRRRPRSVRLVRLKTENFPAGSALLRLLRPSVLQRERAGEDHLCGHRPAPSHVGARGWLLRCRCAERQELAHRSHEERRVKINVAEPMRISSPSLRNVSPDCSSSTNGGVGPDGADAWPSVGPALPVCRVLPTRSDGSIAPVPQGELRSHYACGDERG